MNRNQRPRTQDEIAQRLFELEGQVAAIGQKAILADILFRWWESQQSHYPVSMISLWRITDQAMRDYLRRDVDTE